jgi:hypothetical protein
VAFDIQQGALDSTRAKVEDQLTREQAARVELVLGSHDTLEEHVDDGEVGVVCFNLGAFTTRFYLSQPPQPPFSNISCRMTRFVWMQFTCTKLSIPSLR